MEIKFDNSRHSIIFRDLLGRMSNISIVKNAEWVISAFKPTNLFEFEQTCHSRGLSECQTFKNVISFLAKNPHEDVKIVVKR